MGQDRVSAGSGGLDKLVQLATWNWNETREAGHSEASPVGQTGPSQSGARPTLLCLSRLEALKGGTHLKQSRADCTDSQPFRPAFTMTGSGCCWALLALVGFLVGWLILVGLDPEATFGRPPRTTPPLRYRPIRSSSQLQTAVRNQPSNCALRACLPPPHPRLAHAPSPFSSVPNTNPILDTHSSSHNQLAVSGSSAWNTVPRVCLIFPAVLSFLYAP